MSVTLDSVHSHSGDQQKGSYACKLGHLDSCVLTCIQDYFIALQ